MKELTYDDFRRLVTEIQAANESPNDWAEKVGLNPDVMAEIGRSFTNGIFLEMMEEAHGSEDGVVTGEMEFDPVLGMQVRPVSGLDLASMIASACVNAFIMGFESKKQFGGSSAGE